MKYLLALAFAFVFAATAKATTIPLYNGILVIPDGSQITSQRYEQPGYTYGGRWIADFVFPGGYGNEWDDYNDGGSGWIQFDQPVTNLSVNWISSGESSSFSSCEGRNGCPNTGTLTFNDPMTRFQWAIYGHGSGGVTSMSYTTADAQFAATVTAVPETPSLALLLVGLIGLFLLLVKTERIS